MSGMETAAVFTEVMNEFDEEWASLAEPGDRMRVALARWAARHIDATGPTGPDRSEWDDLIWGKLHERQSVPNLEGLCDYLAERVAASRRNGNTDDVDEIEAKIGRVYALSVEFMAAVVDGGHDPDLTVAAEFHALACSELPPFADDGAIGEAMWTALRDVTAPDRAAAVLVDAGTPT